MTNSGKRVAKAQQIQGHSGYTNSIPNQESNLELLKMSVK